MYYDLRISQLMASVGTDMDKNRAAANLIKRIRPNSDDRCLRLRCDTGQLTLRVVRRAACPRSPRRRTRCSGWLPRPGEDRGYLWPLRGPFLSRILPDSPGELAPATSEDDEEHHPAPDPGTPRPGRPASAPAG